MIWYYLFTFFGNFLNAMFSFLPTVELLPLGMDTALTTAVGYFTEFKNLFPPLSTVFTAFMWYFSFRLILLTLRLFRIIR